MRRTALKSPEFFREAILAKVHPYFAPLRKCLEALRDILYAPRELPTGLRMTDRDFELEQLKASHDAVLAKCKRLLRETVAELAGNSGIDDTEPNEAEETEIPEGSVAKEQGEARKSDQASPQSLDKEHEEPASATLPPPEHIVEAGTNNMVGSIAFANPHIDNSLDEKLETQKPGVKRHREEKADPLQDLTNEGSAKRLKQSEEE